MVDRFYGFRFELVGGGTNSDQTTLTTIQSEANTMGCFGWVQALKPSGNVVGEARCSKGRGLMFKDWLENSAASGKANFQVYADTKIRLHFSHFKILEQDRETCFLDAPHQCSSAASNSNSNGDPMPGVDGIGRDAQQQQQYQRSQGSRAAEL